MAEAPGSLEQASPFFIFYYCQAQMFCHVLYGQGKIHMCEVYLRKDNMASIN